MPGDFPKMVYYVAMTKAMTSIYRIIRHKPNSAIRAFVLSLSSRSLVGIKMKRRNFELERLVGSCHWGTEVLHKLYKVCMQSPWMRTFGGFSTLALAQIVGSYNTYSLWVFPIGTISSIHRMPSTYHILFPRAIFQNIFAPNQVSEEMEGSVQKYIPQRIRVEAGRTDLSLHWW